MSNDAVAVTKIATYFSCRHPTYWVYKVGLYRALVAPPTGNPDCRPRGKGQPVDKF